MQFGRDLGRRNDIGPAGVWQDAAALELLPLGALKRETATVGFSAHQAPKGRRGALLAVYARMLRELARRTSDAETMTKAASAAAWAAKEADNPAAAALVRLEQAETALVAATVFGDAVALDAAESWLDAGVVAPSGAPDARAMALRARIDASRALRAADLDEALKAASAFDEAIAHLEVHVGAGHGARAEAAAARCERADFLIGFGLRLKDKALLKQAEADMRQLKDRLDPDYLPLSWARAQGLRGVALAALGDLSGEPKKLADSVTVLALAAEEAPFDHSPFDRARISHAMGRSLHALAEACEDEGMYDHALVSFDQALAALDGRVSHLKAAVTHDRASCVAARAEASGDLAALARAERAFKAELVFQAGAADPVAWAVAQLSLARVYQARAQLSDAVPDAAATSMALNEALEVFTDRGLKALADEAIEALERLQRA